jgi:hypothetical protein
MKYATVVSLRSGLFEEQFRSEGARFRTDLARAIEWKRAGRVLIESTADAPEPEPIAPPKAAGTRAFLTSPNDRMQRVGFTRALSDK